MEKGMTGIEVLDEAIGLAYVMASGEGKPFEVVEYLTHRINTGYGVRNLYGHRYAVVSSTDTKRPHGQVVFTAKPEDVDVELD